MQVPSGFPAGNRRKAACRGSTLHWPSAGGQGIDRLGAFMLNVRSRTGVVAVTSGAVVLLALPVVASGQVPGVDQVVGGVTQGVGTITQAPAPPAPLPAPAPAPAPRPAPQAAAPAPAAPRSASPAPAAAPRATTSPAGSQGSGASTRTPAHGSARASAASDAGDRGGGATAHASQQSGAPEDEGDIPPARASSGERASGADAGSAAADSPSPGALPFTGLQLALMAIVGCAALAGGAALRRGLRPSRA